MSTYSTMYVGLSGMRSNEGAIGVIGNNIANLNTVGFKGSRAVFSDVLSQTIIGRAGATQLGQGVGMAAVQRLVTQGALLGTNVPTDLAINGNGFFLVDGPDDTQMYTRNGQTQLDSEGFLTTVEGFRIQGYPADADGNLGSQLGDLQIANTSSPPRATTEVNMLLNLNSEAVTPDEAFNPDDPDATSNFSQSMTVYDSLGGAHPVDVYFSRNGTGEWTYDVIADTDANPDTPADVIASGSLSFDENGQMSSESDGAFSVTFANGSAALDITLGFEGTTAHEDPSTALSNDQDGHGVGELQFIEVGLDGTITGIFDNATQQTMGQLAVAMFDSPGGLSAAGNNLFAETSQSGEPAIGVAGSGGRGNVFAGALEQSNVDLTEEFTHLITAQRGFQASSRTITTADEMLVEIVNIKR
ncbi:MAG: flagellar hook protein FlgE [Myxococcota bacterium]|jgi:flagellar hook protein FlgE